MQHAWSLDDVNLQNGWLTIGSFDGVHRGHQEIVRQLTAGAHAVGAPAVVLSFHPHPSVVLGKRNGPIYLTTPEERAALLSKLGVDLVVTHPFNQDVARMTAEEFMRLVCHRLGVKQLWVGYDFALGRGREGNVEMLRKLGETLGYQMNILSPVEVDDQVVSSSQIRTLIVSGDIDKAARFLGRPYRLSGRVEPGDGRGRTIGIPTANLAVWEALVLPRVGVYACRAQIDASPGGAWGAVTNIGIRPTFESNAPTPRVETHLLDYTGDLYGRRISLDFITRLREEQRFPDAQALVAQIHADIGRAREIFKGVERGARADLR